MMMPTVLMANRHKRSMYNKTNYEDFDYENSQWTRFGRVEVIANQRGTTLRRTELSKRQTTLL